MTKRSRFLHTVVLCVSLLFMLRTAMFAQQVTGTLTGTVTDPSGAVVPGATVALVNTLSGDQRSTVSNGEGFFSINAVQPGDYKVDITAPGFERYERTGIHFDPGDKRDLAGIALTLGKSSDTVTVSGEAEQLTPVDSGEKSVVIGQQQLENIAIVGQNAAEFIKLLPGFAVTGGNGANQGYQSQQQSTGAGPVGSFSANGLRTGALDITSDGAHIIDPGCNCGQAVNTVTDMTAEMKVLTSNFGAENSKGPVVITAIGKSGGNQFHGEGYLYARNSVFDATNFYNNSLGTNPLTGKKYAPKPDTSFYYPGANFGGPVLIPGTNFNKNHDKLFFFLAYEYYAQTVQDPSHDVFTSFVPSQEMRDGNFTAAYLNGYLKGTNPGYAVTGPATNNASSNGVATASGQIAPSSFSPIGINMINKLYPLPNADPSLNNGFNFLYATTHTDNMWQLRPRIDWSINDNTKLFVSYNIQREMNHDNSTLWWGTSPAVPYPSPQQQPNHSDSISVNLTKVFSPTATNELVFTYTNLYVGFQYQYPDRINADKLGINYKHVFNNSLNNQVPTITGWSDGVANIINPSGYEKNNTLYADKWLPSVSDNFSKVWGTHTAKFGFYWERTKNEQPSNNYVNGQQAYANWGPASTGNAYADMLTGLLAGYSESNTDPLIAMHYQPVEFYAQDSWKVSRRLTLDYGMRFDHLSPWIDEVGHGAGVFVPSAYQASAPGTALTGFEWHSKDPKIPLSGTKDRFLFYEPRFGIAYDLFGSGKTVLRGGIGWYRFHDEQNVQAAALRLAAGSYDFSVPNPASGPLTFGYIASITPGAVSPSGVRVLDLNDTEQPQTMSYSFTVSQRMPFASTAEVSYVGNQANYLNNASNGTYGNINGLPYGTLFKDTTIWGTADNPKTSPIGAGASKYNPYPQYGQIYQQEHNNYSNYNALQVSWNKQSGHASWLANYTFSKSLGIRGENSANGIADLLNYKNNYGVLPNDRTHIFNVAYVYQFGDFYKGNLLVKGLVNGWQVSGSTQWQSGPPLQANATPNFNMGGPLPAGSLLPNGLVVPSGGNQSSYSISADAVNGTPYILAMPVLTCDPRKGLKANQFMNPNCFAAPSFGHNGAYIWPYVKGPALFDSDLSLFKKFTMTEKRYIEFRVSAFNFLNHALTSWNPGGGDPNLTMNIGPDGKVSNTNFGTAQYKNGNRTVQLVFKLFF